METSKTYVYIPMVLGILALGLAAAIARWPYLIPPRQAVQEITVSPVMGLMTDSLSAKELVVAWEPVPGAVSYCVEYRRAWEKAFTRLPSEFIRGNSALIPDLKTGDEYVIRVKALDEAGLIVGMKKRDCILPPWESPPMRSTFTTGGGVSAESRFGDSVHLEWTPVLGSVGYFLEMRRGEDKLQRISTKPRQETDATISGLRTGEAYSFRVIAVGRDGQLAKPMDVTHVCVRVASAIEPPGEISFSAEEAVGILKWTAVPGAKGYHAYYYRQEGGPLMRATRVPEEHAEVILRALKPGIYGFAVSSVDGAGKEGRQSRPVRGEVVAR